ncbi:MAG: Threonylcarbamoyl-AMP synthase [candidate division TA06 bacterium ADurb.Bin131]|uniref:L-threonylcarbamoyladenylate synthase n=1 Tax=candidate division TA06 bacterium ADurb.Bin131 TaxID=1852827 RepID=A0A1V6CA29_UNCT6|nr:MAG: Threonylcarbamoyl-AMP synthase [candidate division TA06 bacterium ADurb.Bin131]
MTDILKLTRDNRKIIVEKIGNVLKNSGVAIIPTDTVYGIVCNGEDDTAKTYIYTIKNRPEHKPLIAFVRDIEQANKIAYIQQSSLNFVSNRWPGKNTFIFKSKIKSKYIVSSDNTIGIRIPDFDLINHLTSIFPYLASTSANISFRGSTSSIDEVEPELINSVQLVVDAGKLYGKESAIWDTTTSLPKLLRGKVLFVCSGNSCRSPMAQCILKHIIGNQLIDVISAGTSVIKENPSLESIVVMKEIGLDISNFTTNILTADIIDSSDIIFAMEDRHRNIILEMSPSCYDKITVLNIPDPAGKDISYYREIRDIISDKIKTQVLTRIKNENRDSK